jgi:hypothetical protein
MIVRNARYKQVLPGVVGYKGNLYTKAYAKGELLFDYTNDEYETQYFTTESLEDGNTITLTIPATLSSSYMTSFSYSTDGGLTWTTLNVNSTNQSMSVSINKGDKVLWKGVGNRIGYGAGVGNGAYFNGSKEHIVYGNILSILKGDDFISNPTIPAARPFAWMFYNDTQLVSAKNLVLAKSMPYGWMYNGTFYGCSKLVEAPDLTKTTSGNITQESFSRTFQGCTSLVEAPELPNAQLTGNNNCYQMFFGCTSLTTAPELPATTLAQECYKSMFYDCTSLTTAPELPATTLAQECYQAMFYNCISLNYIKCLATDISATNCTQYWVQNVAPTGDFVKDPSMNDWLIDNVNGIPIGWTLHGVATYTVTLTVNDSNMGVADGAGTYSAGDQVVLRADAFTGYSFVGWYNGSTLVSSDTTYVFNIYSNISYEARFAQGGHNYANDYLTIEMIEENGATIFIDIPSEFSGNTNYITSISWSKDNGTTWTTKNMATEAANTRHIYQISLSLGEKLLIKGIGNSVTKGVPTANWCSGSELHIYGNKKWKVSGNIMSLLYGDNFSNVTSSKTFFKLFTNPKTKLSGNNTYSNSLSNSFCGDASNLVLPTMTSYCYQEMFCRCNSLKYPPDLPATSLSKSCYESMFDGCNSLESAPILPATSLADRCYYIMFGGCKNIKTPPSLPATTMKTSCYEGMFSGSGILYAPALPATILAEACYRNMFGLCKGLASVPNLPALECPKSCYESMFYYCSNITSGASLPATTLGKEPYSHMFEGTKITYLEIYAENSAYGPLYIWGWYPEQSITPVGTFYCKQNATTQILNARPRNWTLSQTL